jgi:hypothetical protein
MRISWVGSPTWSTESPPSSIATGAGASPRPTNNRSRDLWTGRRRRLSARRARPPPRNSAPTRRRSRSQSRPRLGDEAGDGVAGLGNVRDPRALLVQRPPGSSGLASQLQRSVRGAGCRDPADGSSTAQFRSRWIVNHPTRWSRRACLDRIHRKGWTATQSAAVVVALSPVVY